MPMAATAGALGIVYGDIGTSPLYAFREAMKAGGPGGSPAPEAVLGVVSLIIWALLLIVSLKYAILILRADNRGEGGIGVGLGALTHGGGNWGGGGVGPYGRAGVKEELVGSFRWHLGFRVKEGGGWGEGAIMWVVHRLESWAGVSFWRDGGLSSFWSTGGSPGGGGRFASGGGAGMIGSVRYGSVGGDVVSVVTCEGSGEATFAGDQEVQWFLQGERHFRGIRAPWKGGGRGGGGWVGRRGGREAVWC